MSARLFRVILPVSDVERAARFYGEVLGEPGRRTAKRQARTAMARSRRVSPSVASVVGG